MPYQRIDSSARQGRQCLPTRAPSRGRARERAELQPPVAELAADCSGAPFRWPLPTLQRKRLRAPILQSWQVPATALAAAPPPSLQTPECRAPKPRPAPVQRSLARRILVAPEPLEAHRPAAMPELRTEARLEEQTARRRDAGRSPHTPGGEALEPTCFDSTCLASFAKAGDIHVADAFGRLSFEPRPTAISQSGRDRE